MKGTSRDMDRIMQKNNTFIIFALALSLLLSPLLSSISYAENEDYQIRILNLVQDESGESVEGSTYNIYKTHDWTKDGSYVKLKERRLMNEEPVKVTKTGAVFNVREKGVYEIEQVKRAPGYYSFGTFLENEEDKPLTMTVEFPKMENGVIAKNQEIIVAPKLDPVLADVGLLKTGENTSYDNNGLDGVRFKLVQTHDESLEKLEKPSVISESLRTSGGGYVKLSNLKEGRYELLEMGTSKIDGTSPEEIYADAEGTHLFDEKPVRFTITLDEAGKTLDVYTHNEKGEKLAEIKKVEEGEDNPIGASYYVSKKNYRVSTLDKKVEGKEEFFTNIGVPFEFTFETKIPTNISDYTEFGIVDRLDSRFDYMPGSVFAKIDNEKLPLEHFKVDFDEAGKTLSIFFDLEDDEFFTSKAGKDIVIGFEAQLNSHASTGEKVPNTGELVFDNGFGVKQTTKSKTVFVHPNEGSIKIIKVDKDDHNKKLAGAVFALIDKETGEVAKDVDGIEFRGITDSNGELVFNKVPFGSYTIVEEKAPAGYIKIEEEVDLVLDRGSDYLEYSFTIENERDGSPIVEKQDDPDTGVYGPLIMISLGVMLLAVYLKLSVKKERE